MKKTWTIVLIPLLLGSCKVRSTDSVESDKGSNGSVCSVPTSGSTDTTSSEDSYMNKDFGFDAATRKASFSLSDAEIQLDFFYAQWQKKRNPSVFYNHTVAFQYVFSSVAYPELDRDPNYQLSNENHCEACFPLAVRQGKVLFLDNGTKGFVDEHIITSGELRYDEWEPDRCLVETKIDMDGFLEFAKTGRYLQVSYVPNPADDGYVYDENGKKTEWVDFKGRFNHSSMIQTFEVEITESTVNLTYVHPLIY